MRPDKYHSGVPTDRHAKWIVHGHSFNAPNNAIGAAVANTLMATMATKWTFESAASQGVTGTVLSGSTPFITPNINDLIVVFSECTRATTPVTSIGISALGAPWILAGNTTLTSPPGNVVLYCWYKIANATDYQSGIGTPVTCTAVGGSGSIRSITEADVFRFTGGGVISVADIVAVATGSAGATTLTWSPSTGANLSNQVDALAVSCRACAAGPGASTGTNTFTGTSAAASLLATGVSLNNNQLVRYALGVQGSATAGTNSFVNTWTNSVAVACLGFTFVYEAGNMLAVMGL